MHMSAVILTIFIIIGSWRLVQLSEPNSMNIAPVLLAIILGCARNVSCVVG